MATCTGFNSTLIVGPTSSPVTGGGDDGLGQNSGSLNLAPIIGGVVGGLAVVMAGAFIIQRRRKNSAVDEGLARAWEEKLFRKSKDRQFEMSMAAATGGALTEFGTQDVSEAQATASEKGEMKIQLRTRFSFHGEAMEDELDVPAGAVLTGVDRNRDWWVAIDEATHTVGLIPAAYCSQV